MLNCSSPQLMASGGNLGEEGLSFFFNRLATLWEFDHAPRNIKTTQIELFPFSFMGREVHWWGEGGQTLEH